MIALSALASVFAFGPPTAGAATITYGDIDMLGQGTYGSDPRAGATREGLAADVVTMATLDFAQQIEQSGAQRMLIASVEPDLESAKRALGEFSENVIAKLGTI